MTSQVEPTLHGKAAQSVRTNPKRLAEIELWRTDLRVLLRVLQDSRTPWYASALMFCVLLWGAMPVDPLPDVIPLAGIADDVTVFLIIRSAVYRMIPDEIIDYHTEIVAESKRIRFGPARAVASIVVVQILLIFVALGAFGLLLV
ncbi:YkvA family protein [Haladaptatus sp. YSMS36]|uniref:YkvA family protein n=1 Tax=Haladaptatus sp. YSMS36 TaxID=3033384 RepID=UPI0023E87B19|nr:DUF1232 domain-containing protein [Haladaptatus sp. YSMS36]